MLCDALVMELLEGADDFVVYCDASNQDYKAERIARLYINEIIARHNVPVSMISGQSFPIKILAIAIESIRNATGYMYCLPPPDRW
ncbi:hypothetical protein Tco_0986567 [Tanacetum coccineum]